MHNYFISSLSFADKKKTTFLSVILLVWSEIAQDQPFVRAFFIENSHNYGVEDVHICSLLRNKMKLCPGPLKVLALSLHCCTLWWKQAPLWMTLHCGQKCLSGFSLAISFRPLPKVLPLLTHESAKWLALLRQLRGKGGLKYVQPEELNL